MVEMSVQWLRRSALLALLAGIAAGFAWSADPAHAGALTQDLGIDLLLHAMAGEDPFLRDVARKVVLSAVVGDVDVIRYRQAILVDAMRAPEVTRELTVGPRGSSGIDAQLDARGYKFVAHKNKFGQEYKSSGKDRY